MLESLKKEVCEANLELVREGLVFHTWGNASGISRQDGFVVIKPSGVSYHRMKPRDMVVVDLNGNIVEGEYSPSVDLPIHLEIYKSIDRAEAVIHTHSHYATCWAQARKSIPCYGTTHADYFLGDIPLTNLPKTDNYEVSTGRAIVECVKSKGVEWCKAVLVPGHGPFCWAEDIDKCIEVAKIVEELARLAYDTFMLSEGTPILLEKELLEKHFRRKWGPDAYYGQKR
ncbi:MAG: L-ribulose-5-phosphate 4-epimerase AraD [Candidatus Hydrogenedentes bacterium]|nr:L-ribulose-5-phosphate 4-epimerase AraD [Candidatus Hydrogenedentota bacterium]